MFYQYFKFWENKMLRGEKKLNQIKVNWFIQDYLVDSLEMQ